ncbi:MAG: AbrB/MazE/SpoVT family DNA-binding domain-containing protein [Gemmatimonadetes bacterium]|nr:AbrB/MazE/SpoVT family DNA-binding domain-containing protein [Gemmatimonadota bacterium]MCY3611092.1 AbrB/MazE/SpoVT family DNA-binding domain-containing protein [Gemmatimonadota bacterium]MCY3677163.1 AbrB/MazE/SpoVT family DNA-binding domain-containing protein [Gemmatimonadota bacterium]MYA44591.1 AbrB/MazE/SpoVT family DNA-binding domain-containing protein [Gemmatimonadota bacterium]MYE93182.1 AbrB/MazE/SpoVT family DNA-binding domain-containing protein [Gemmatimonadota bacterium]
MLESSVTKKGRTTLPKPVRDALGVQAGDRVRYVVLDGEVRILPVRPIRRLFGALKHDGPPVTVEEMKRAVADAASEE